MLVMLAVDCGAVLAFEVWAFLTGKTGGWVRYYIVIIPLTGAAGGVDRRPRGRTHHRGRACRPAGALPTGASKRPPALWSGGTAMKRPGRRRPVSWPWRWPRCRPAAPSTLGRHADRHGSGCQGAPATACRRIAASAKRTSRRRSTAWSLPDSSVLVDVFLSFGSSSTRIIPDSSSITPTGTSRPILADPPRSASSTSSSRSPHMELKPSLDAINRQYPTCGTTAPASPRWCDVRRRRPGTLTLAPRSPQPRALPARAR